MHYGKLQQEAAKRPAFICLPFPYNPWKQRKSQSFLRSPMIKWWNLSGTIINLLVQNLPQTQQVEFSNNYLKQITQVFPSTPRWDIHWIMYADEGSEFLLWLFSASVSGPLGGIHLHPQEQLCCLPRVTAGPQYPCSRMQHSFKVSW